MNDENSVVETTEASPHQACDTPEKEDAPAGVAHNSAPAKETPTGTDEASSGLFTDTGTDSDPDCEGSDSQTQESELEQLRSELKQLRQEIADRDARMAQDARIEREYTEFCELFPGVSVESLSGEVWKDIENGASLAAAYALAEKKQSVALARATNSNTNNRVRSAGAVHNTQNYEFSPAEVRAMTSQEVRANLPKIMRSMQKWH